MDPDKHYLPAYSVTAAPVPAPLRRPNRLRRIRRSSGLRLIGLACLAFIAYAQWKQTLSPNLTASGPDVTRHGLSVKRLREDVGTCARLHTKPSDPKGLGREKNARYIDGQKPTLIRNATVWVGEPDGEKGYSWIVADVFLEHGLIKQVGRDLHPHALPGDVLVYDAAGRPLTSGIIDMHSHAGVHPLPTIRSNDDTSELSADITPYVRTIDAIQPTDHQLQVIKSGGVTTSLILPGSGNNIGGEAFVVKHAIGRRDGRNETSVADLLADPDRTWRYMKMACGENPKHIHGKAGERGPVSRLGQSWEFRHAFEQAAKVLRDQDDWCHAASSNFDQVRGYLPNDIRWEALLGVLRGQVHVNVHCYTITDFEAFVDHTNEFKFPVRAFHHAHQAYLVPGVLKRAWGDDPPALALFADNMWYKAESYIGSEYAGKRLYDNGLVPIYVSDNPILNAQHLVLEAAKAYRYGLPYHAALASVTSAPAERLGLGQRLGKVKPGFDADIVVWDSDPLSLGAAPVQVWIDGTAQYEDPITLHKPFEGTISPDPDLATIIEDPVTITTDVLVTGITKILAPNNAPNTTTNPTADPHNKTFNLTISGGTITCIGQCRAADRHTPIIHLRNGHLTAGFTAFGSTLGLNAIDDAKETDNGAGAGAGRGFTRALDGLALDTAKLRAAHRYGVTRAVSAPKLLPGDAFSHHGTSAGFRTGAGIAVDKAAVWAADVAVHYSVDLGSVVGGRDGGGGEGSVSAAVGGLRRKLMRAVEEEEEGEGGKEEEGRGGYYVEEAGLLRRVVRGKMPLVITVHSADTIAALLRVKREVEEAGNAVWRGRRGVGGEGGRIRMVILGGAEAYLVARELAESGVGVVLAPMLAFGVTWDQRRALTGAPLTNGTGIDVLVEAGVVTAVGPEEDWVVRDLGLLAGIAWRNGGGRLGEEEAVGLVSGNLYNMLGLEEPDMRENFVVHEGSPLEIGSRVKVVGGGLGNVKVYSELG
ncbi:Carbohydrate esterase family 9 protein [Madurella fahalii]|uniref:Carbohydrate esterase family 9 protein n=1 Tax=Madurella fahalii TaxID=1157608 RepID=A0ABQ0GHE6_9PEZI